MYAIKEVGGKSFERSRLVFQKFKDKDALKIPMKLPTTSRVAQRFAVFLAAALPGMKYFSRKFSQAYIQSVFNRPKIVSTAFS